MFEYRIIIVRIACVCLGIHMHPLRIFVCTKCTLLFVVVMHLSRAACAALAAEVGPAAAAEQLGCQQIIVLGLVTRRGLFVLRQLLLHPVKEVLRYDCGDAVRHDHIAVLELPGIDPFPNSFVFLITSTFMFGEIMYSAPALAASSTSFVLKTVPAPK